jgi:hypothetical protein
MPLPRDAALLLRRRGLEMDVRTHHRVSAECRAGLSVRLHPFPKSQAGTRTMNTSASVLTRAWGYRARNAPRTAEMAPLAPSIGMPASASGLNRSVVAVCSAAAAKPPAT